MNRTPNPAPSLKKSRPVAPAPSGNHTCLQCPACGSEACRTMQDLGMYCDTALAAWESMRVEKHPKKKPPNAA